MCEHDLKVIQQNVELLDNAEEWRDIPGFEGAYQVSDLGRVRSLDREQVYPACVTRSGQHRAAGVRRWHGRVLKLNPDDKGYFYVGLKRDCAPVTRAVHQLVALAFIGPRPTSVHEIAHWDRDPANNRPGNLRWATRLENHADKKRHGTTSVGERAARARLTNAQAAEIRVRHANGERQNALAREFGAHVMTVNAVVHGRSYAH